MGGEPGWVGSLGRWCRTRWEGRARWVVRLGLGGREGRLGGWLG